MDHKKNYPLSQTTVLQGCNKHHLLQRKRQNHCLKIKRVLLLLFLFKHFFLSSGEITQQGILDAIVKYLGCWVFSCLWSFIQALITIRGSKVHCKWIITVRSFTSFLRLAGQKPEHTYNTVLVNTSISE